MVFSSILFLFRFLPIVLLLYYILPVWARNGLLFFVSLLFYAWGEPVYVTLMIFSTIVDYVLGKRVSQCRQRGDQAGARLAVILSAVINLSLLGFFKYGDFLIGTVNSLTGASIPLMNLALPIGISFYTFQTMSYTIDVYRGEAEIQNSVLDFGTYVALFPQLIAGPIVRYQTVAEELRSRKENLDDFASGVQRFIIGLGKKVLLANNAGLIWDAAREMGDSSVLVKWLGIVAFGLQIYFDFSGYSDMAIGLGKMFGFHFLENFNYPYLSRSVTEFWRRWHISLGTWFREYVYIPLGGNRCGKGRQIRNIMIVWLLTGFWHGASWNFLIWGLYYGLLLLMEKYLLGEKMKQWPVWLQHSYMIFATLIGWAIFAFDSMTEGAVWISQMFGAGGLPLANRSLGYLFTSNLALLLIAVIASTGIPNRVVKKLRLDNTMCTAAWLMLIFLLSVAYLVDASYNPFLYFRF